MAANELEDKQPADKGQAASAYAQFFGLLTPAAAAAIEAGPGAGAVHDDDEGSDYASFASSLSGTAAASVSSPASAAEAPPDRSSFKYCVVEAHDGEWARVTVCGNAEAAARKLAELEGEDVVAWPFYGVPLAFTKGPQRCLTLADGLTAISLPLTPGGKIHTLDATLLDPANVQDDGYLGPQELAAAPAAPRPKKAPKGRR